MDESKSGVYLTPRTTFKAPGISAIMLWQHSFLCWNLAVTILLQSAQTSSLPPRPVSEPAVLGYSFSLLYGNPRAHQGNMLVIFFAWSLACFLHRNVLHALAWDYANRQAFLQVIHGGVHVEERGGVLTWQISLEGLGQCPLFRTQAVFPAPTLESSSGTSFYLFSHLPQSAKI